MIKRSPFSPATAMVGVVCFSLIVSPLHLHAQRPKAARAKPSPAASPAAAALATPAALTGANVENPPPTDPAADNPASQTTETEILATDGANFSSKERIAVFTGNVRVNDPRFQLACDELTVYLAKGATPDGTAAATPTPTPTPLAAGSPAPGGAKEPDNPGGGIDHAIAKGHVIIIQKRAPAKPGDEPKISIGRAEWGMFDNKTGDMVLKGSPSVEQNGNTHVALLPTTVMTLHRDNSMMTVGPSRTLITQRKNAMISIPGGPGSSPEPAGSPQPGASPGGRRRAGGNP